MSIPGDTMDSVDPLHTHVLSFLTVEERMEIPDPTRTKVALAFEELTRKIHANINQKQKDRIAYEGQIRTFEAQLKELREDSNTANEQLNKERKTSEEYVEKYRSSLATINRLEFNLQNLQSSFNDASLKVERLTSEKDELLVTLNKRNKEIEDLTQHKNELSEQLHSATAAKIEAMFKVDEFTSKKLDLDYREKELEKEREWVNKQVQLLNAELDRKQSQIVEMQREYTTKLFACQAELAQKAEEFRNSELSLANVNTLNSTQEEQIERLLSKLRDSQEMEQKIEESYRLELQSQSRIADLYKENAEESKKKVEELESAVENLQGLLNMATERYGELETQFSRSAKSYQEEVASRDSKINALEAELRQANELLKDLHEKGLTEEMIESLSPAAAAVSNLLRGTYSLTEIYSKLTAAQEELLLVQAENARLNETLNNVLSDITARGPLLKAQKEDYARSLETIDALTNQLELAMEAESKVREECSNIRKNTSALERENSRLKVQVNDNCNQIKVLMQEIETLRGTYVFESDETPGELEHTSGLIDSSSLITSRLVTFRNIDELQSQNAYLLSLVRELSEEREKMRDSVDAQTRDDIKAAYEEVQRELEDLKAMRLRQESVMANVRDQQTLTSPSKTALGNSCDRDSASASANDDKFSQLDTAYKELKQDFEIYCREKATNETIASEQMEKLREDVSRLRTENAKLSSQIDYNNERAKIYATNLETYKKVIASLEEKNKQLSLTVAKHEQSSQLIRNELVTNQEKLARAEISLSTLTTERNSLRDSKARIKSELDLYKREERTCKSLEINLSELKNSLEMSLTSTKIKYEEELKALKDENILLRRKTEAEGEQLKTNFNLWEKVTQELEIKAKNAAEAHDKAKDELIRAESTIRSQRSEIEKLIGQVQVLTGHADGSVTLNTLQSLQAEREQQTREVNVKIGALEREAVGYKQQIHLLKSSLEEYKNLAKSLEEQVGQSNSEMVDDKLRFKDDMIRDLQCKLDATEKELSQVKSEKESCMAEFEGKLQTMSIELNRLGREISVENSKFTGAVEENEKLKADLEHQLQVTTELKAKYDNEITFHSQVVKDRNQLRSELDSLRSSFAAIEREKIMLEEELKELKEGSEGRLKSLSDEIQQLSSTVVELDNLNTSLQDQLIALTTQIEGRRVDASTTNAELDTSFTTATYLSNVEDEDKKRSTEHWVQLLRYMRRQKEIAYSKVEMSESTVVRLKSQLDFAEKKLKELESSYSDLQSQSQTSIITSTKTAELLRKIETLSALTDSNRLLREEREALHRQLIEARSHSAEIESKVQPLSLAAASLEAQVDTLKAENASLKQDLSRWRARANALIDKANKFNPEEMKKITAEKDTLVKQVNALEESRKKLYTENGKLDLALKTTQAEKLQLNNSLQLLTAEQRRLTEELKKVNDYKTGLATELEKVQKELLETKRLTESKRMELDLAETKTGKLTEEVEEQKAMVKNVKTIARRYKKQYEDLLKESDTQKENPESQVIASGSQTNSNVNSAQISDLEARVAELSAHNEILQRDLEGVRIDTTKREEQAKVALKSMRDKMAAMVQQRSEQDSELNATKSKLSTMEASTEEASIRLAAMKSQYEGRLSRLEKENKDLRAHAGEGGGSSELGTENEKLKKENEIQRQRILALEKQLLLKSGGVAGSSGTTKVPAPGDKTHSTDPPKANIKPIAPSTPKVATTQMVPPSNSRPQPTASIRPMSMTRKATVMPTTATTPAPQAPSQAQGPSLGMLCASAPVSQAQVSTSTPDQSVEASGHHTPVTSSATGTGTVTNSANVRQATVQPTQAVSLIPILAPQGPILLPGVNVSGNQAGAGTTEGGTGTHAQEPPSTSTTSHMDSEMGDSSEQVSSSESSHQTVNPVAPIRSSQEAEGSSFVQPVSSQEAEGGAPLSHEEPSPSTTTTRPTQSSKRTREDDEVETTEAAPPCEEPDSKRTRLVPNSSEVSINREAEARGTRHQFQELGRDDGESEEDEPQVPHSGRNRGAPEVRADDDEDDKDSDVVVVEDSEEERQEDMRRLCDDDEGEAEMGDEEEDDEGGDGEEDEEAEVEEAVEEYDEMGDEDEDPDDIEIVENEDAEEGREAESIEEMDEESVEEGEEDEVPHGTIEEGGGGSQGEVEESVEQDASLLDGDGDDYDVDMNQEAGEASPVNPNGNEEALMHAHAPVARQAERVDRGSYQTQQQQLAMTPTYQMYGGEEADDSIVPSTPTLCVPRRTDGFAEAVSSPHVSSIGRQFVFGGSNESSGIDFQHFEEGCSGRSVPTTPLPVSPTAEIEEQDDSNLEDGEVEGGDGDGQPSSSNAPRHTLEESFGTVPTLNITASTERPSEDSRVETRNPTGSSEQGIDEVGTEAPRTEVSVTSSDEDKLDSAGSSVSGSQAASISRSLAEQQTQQQQQQQRARPTPIVWDQPTSSSSAAPAGHSNVRLGHRPRPVPLMRSLPATHGGVPDPTVPARGGHFRGRGGQSARRSRPHGRGWPPRGS